MKNIIKAGVIGLGARGSAMLDGVLLKNPEIEVTAVCDIYEDRRESAKEKVEKRTAVSLFRRGITMKSSRCPK